MKKNNDKVEIIEVWQPVEKGGEAIRFSDGKHLKKVAIFCNGTPILLTEDWAVERKVMTRKEFENKYNPL